MRDTETKVTYNVVLIMSALSIVSIYVKIDHYQLVGSEH